MVQVIASNVSAAIAIATHQVHVLPATDFKLMIFPSGFDSYVDIGSF